jgi:PAS domain S-box-containing protein
MKKKRAPSAGTGKGAGKGKQGNTAAGARRTEGKGTAAKDDLRRRALAFLEADPDRLAKLSVQESGELVHELGTYQIELEMQNDELRRIQGELEESRRRYQDLFEQAPVAYFTLDAKGLIREVNATAAVMLEREKGALLRTPFSLLAVEEEQDSLYLYLRNIAEGRGRIGEIGLRREDGSRVTAQLEAIPVLAADGKVIEIRIAATDISDRKRAEKKLQRKSALMRAIIDATDVMLVYLDPQFNFLWINPAYAQACNMPPEELVGRNHFALFPHKENEEIFRRVRDTGEPAFYKDKPFEFPDQPERGITYWDWSLAPVKDPAGKVSALVFSLRETTRYKQAELRLVESEERFRRMAETSSDIIFQLGRDGTVTYASPAVHAFGHAPEQVQGRSFSEFITAGDLAQASDALARVMDGKSISLLELHLIKADGAAAVCEISATPMVREGAVIGVQGITRDITLRKMTEEALRRSEAQLRAVLESLHEGVIVSDLAGNLNYWNPAAVHIHGFSSSAEYLRALPEFKDIFELATPEEGIIPLERWPLSRIFAGETLRAWEVNVRRLDVDRRRVYRYSGTLVRNPEGTPLLAVLTVGDITERKNAEERIRRSNALLQGIREIFEAGLNCTKDDELASASLRVAERLTGSSFGFIGEIGPDGLLHDLAISDTGWQECAMDDEAGHRGMAGNLRIAGLYGQVLAEGAPFFTNDPSSHPARIGTPLGHPSLTSFLGVPLGYREKTIGLVALANRDGGYGAEERDAVQALAPAFVETLFKGRMERALRESEARERSNALQFKQFLDFTPIPVWIAHDPECRVITRNLAAARLVGLDPDVKGSRSASEEKKVPPVQVFKNGKKLTQDEMPLRYAIKHGIRVEAEEIDIVPAGGNARRMLGTAAPLYDAEGQVRGGIAAYMDITERKWMEEQLLQAKQEWEKTFDAVPDLITILDPQHRIVRVNRAMAERMEMSPSKCMGNFCFHCVHHTSHPIGDCPNALTLRDGRQHMAEVHEENLGGDFLVTTTPIFDEQGEIQVTVHVARDITQVKEAARLLKESEERLNRAQRIAHLGSWELDIERNVLSWSDEVFRIFGMEPQSLVPCYEDFLSTIHPDDREKVHNIFMDSLRAGDDGYEIEHRIVQKSTGRIRYVHEKCEHFRDESGKVVGSGGMVQDITERNEADKKILILNNELERNIRQLAISNKELARSNEDLQQYAYIISHDLQEPLRSVASFVQLLSRRYQGKLDAKADTFINFAVEGAAHMQRLLSDLLRFSRVGGGKLHLERVSLETVLKKTMHHLQNALDESGALIEAESLPVVFGDEMQLNTLLQNLISNALKFKGEKPPRIHISSKKQAHEWIICVRDNGIGIDPQFAERIFLIFQRLHRRDEYTGTGIGLAICKKVVERHGGHIWVESAPGEGAAFYFSLPREGVERVSPATPERREEQAGV